MIVHDVYLLTTYLMVLRIRRFYHSFESDFGEALSKSLITKTSPWQYLLKFWRYYCRFCVFSLLFHNTAALGIPQASSQGELMHLDIVKILTCQTDAFHSKNNYLCQLLVHVAIGLIVCSPPAC